MNVMKAMVTTDKGLTSDEMQENLSRRPVEGVSFPDEPTATAHVEETVGVLQGSSVEKNKDEVSEGNLEDRDGPPRQWRSNADRTRDKPVQSQEDPEVSEKPITAGYLEMQAGLLKESVDFPQGDTTVITQPVKAVYVDVADPVTAKNGSIPLQVKGDGEKIFLNANFEDETVWFDMQSAKGITPEQQAQVAEILAEIKDVFCSRLQ
uniref:Uncharacterized protein n=1 Tax=Sphaerodactylus townsendi TaxID=933632 RepID=A0ACB8EEZ9_9SAUR